MNILVKIRDLSLGYNNIPVIGNVNFDIARHDYIGIIGPNGGGKTTLIKGIAGLLRPLTGSILFSNNNEQYTRKAGFGIGYLPQSRQLDTKFPITVAQLVLSGLISPGKLIGGYSREEKQKASASMENTGLLALSDKPIGHLSGGQLQRALLARAIISMPSLLVLDEPGNFVDNQFEKEMYAILKELNQQMAILMVSHDAGIIAAHVKNIICVSGNVHYHPGNEISEEILKAYQCPIELITHGTLPHRVLKTHQST